MSIHSPIRSLRIATRRSTLAMMQARYVASRLHAINPALQISFVKIETEGDKNLDVSLTKLGGKGIFIKALEHALLEDAADIAVHSVKDLPELCPPTLHVPVICEREDPRDTLVSFKYASMDQLPQNAIIGTSSLRRQSQILAIRPDIKIQLLRGNVETRLNKLKAEGYDAAILAVAGLKRLGLTDHITEIIPPESALPAAGQGAIGIECSTNKPDIEACITPLHDEKTAVCIRVERALVALLNGSCQTPIGSYATLQDRAQSIYLRAFVGTPDGRVVITAEAKAACQAADTLAPRVAQTLLKKGAGAILSTLPKP